MTAHVLKTWSGPFAAVRDGKKRHEVRINDRDFKPGDTVLLVEYLPPTDTLPDVYSGAEISATIGYLSRGGEWGLPDGLCVFTLLDVQVLQ